MNMQKVDFTVRFALQGAEPRGALFSPSEIAEVENLVNKEAAAIEDLRAKSEATITEELRAKGEAAIKREFQAKKNLAFLELPYAYEPQYGKTVFGETFSQTLEEIKKAAKIIRSGPNHFVHIGIGGSALGAITLINALGDSRSEAKIYVPDNVDPDWIAEIMRQLDLRRTYMNVVSKSGDTVETISTFAILWEKMRTESGLSEEELKQRVFITTNQEKGALAELRKSKGFKPLDLPDVVHGRFSVFSPMGLMTAAVAGVDIGGLLQGARQADQETAQFPFMENPARQLAALHYLGQTKKRISDLILLPYSNRLRTVADWYSQLVAESLGKQGQGITPVKALGVTDQHSQLQLYNDGPKNKLIILFSIRKHAETIYIPESIGDNVSYDYLSENKTLNELFKAECEATEISLYQNGVPSCHFKLAEVNAFNMGYLLTVLEKTVCILGRLLGVNAFDQPGVEESKKYARAMLGKEGEEYKRLRQMVEKFSG